MIWSAQDIAKTLESSIRGHGGEQIADICGIEIDHRRIKKGDLFIALKGENHDGHDYAELAYEAGAVLILSERPLPVPHIINDDNFKALEKLAIAARNRMQGVVIAITGSVGKTGTKHMMESCLKNIRSKNGDIIHASLGNYNNHIGVPLSLARMPQNAAYGIFELAMNHSGEIAKLSQMVRPDIAIITLISHSHVGNFASNFGGHFSSLDEIAEAKAEIFTGMTGGGIALLNSDDPYKDRLAAVAAENGIKKIITCGYTGDADIQITNVDKIKGGLVVAVEMDEEVAAFTLGMTAPHWALSAAMTLAACAQCGISIHGAAHGIASVSDIDGRGKRHIITLGDGRQFYLIDDSYNASPASMTAALENFAEISGRKIAILGDMLELGDKTRQHHENLMNVLQLAGLSMLVTIGEEMQRLGEQLENIDHIHYTPPLNDAEAAKITDDIISHITHGDSVLVKGSNGMKTSRIANCLINKNLIKESLMDNKGANHVA